MSATSQRNWAKARLMGMTFDPMVFTEKEREILAKMMGLKQQLLARWDGQTELFIGHALKPYKCNSCGRRSDKQYIIENVNYCKKDFEKLKEDLERRNISIIFADKNTIKYGEIRSDCR